MKTNSRVTVRRTLIAAALAIAVAAGGAVATGGPAGAAVAPEAGQFVPLTPARIVNDVSVAAAGTYALNPLGKGGIPAAGVSAVTLTITARSTGTGQLIVFPAGTTRPGTSNVNF